MRVDSSVEAQMKKTRALNSARFFVCASITRTPVTRRVCGSKTRLVHNTVRAYGEAAGFLRRGESRLRLLKYEAGNAARGKHHSSGRQPVLCELE